MDLIWEDTKMADIDWDPRHSSLFTGAGTAWGPATYGSPGAQPTIPGERNLNEFQAFDQSGLVNQLKSNIKGSQANQQLAAQRQAAASGAGGSDAARAMNQSVASNAQNQANAVDFQAAKEAWDSRMQQKQFAEQKDLQRYMAALDAWKANQANYLAEKGSRNSALGMFGSLFSQY